MEVTEVTTAKLRFCHGVMTLYLIGANNGEVFSRFRGHSIPTTIDCTIHFLLLDPTNRVFMYSKGERKYSKCSLVFPL